jgi:hypothetical protein
MVFVTAVVCPSAFEAEHDLVKPVVGPGIVIAARQSELVASCDTSQCRTTLFPWELPRYHPFVPEIPSIVYVIVGGAADAVGANTSRTPRPRAKRKESLDLNTLGSFQRVRA